MAYDKEVQVTPSAKYVSFSVQTRVEYCDSFREEAVTLV